MNTRTAVVAAVLLASLSACSGDKDTTSPPPTSTTPTSTTTSRAGPSSTKTSSPTTTPSTSRPSSSYSTKSVSVNHKIYVPPVPVLGDIRPAQHPESNYDRVTFDVEGNLIPSYTVRYVERPVSDGSGQPVNVKGNYYVEIVFQPLDAHNQSGNPTAPRRLTTNYKQVKECVVSGDFEAVTTVVCGTNTKTGFLVKEISDGRVYIDFSY